MNRELLILRHGKSDWSHSVTDFQRPLNKRGHQETSSIGAWLAEKNLAPDHVISSPAERARQTLESTCKAMSYPMKGVSWDEAVYMAGIDDLLESIGTAPETCQRLMLVGHNPGLEYLVFYLTGNAVAVPDDGKVLATATLARVRISGAWQGLERGCGELLQLVRGGQLP